MEDSHNPTYIKLQKRVFLTIWILLRVIFLLLVFSVLMKYRKPLFQKFGVFPFLIFSIIVIFVIIMVFLEIKSKKYEEKTRNELEEKKEILLPPEEPKEETLELKQENEFISVGENKEPKNIIQEVAPDKTECQIEKAADIPPPSLTPKAKKTKPDNEKIEKIIVKNLKRVNKLIDIIDSTTDENELFLSLNEVNDILFSLIQYENIIDFSYSPSQMLNDITNKQAYFMEQVYRKTRLKNLDNFARECNAYLEKQDRNEKLEEEMRATQVLKEKEIYYTPNISKFKSDKYDYMEGHDFEYFCAELLQKNGYDDVSVTASSGDQGVDIIAIKNGVRYGIQCKRYSSDIGNKAVQEVYSGAKFYNCHVPVVLTNRYFTKSAIELATKTNVLLWDRNELNKLIGIDREENYGRN